MSSVLFTPVYLYNGREYEGRTGQNTTQTPDEEDGKQDTLTTGLWQKRINNGSSSINTDGKQGENTGRNSEVGDKVVDATVEGSKLPNSTQKKP